jgi:hypothetical protein
MKRWIGVAILVFVGAAGWRAGALLSPDALSMAIGVLFGVLAGIPTSLLMMAGMRRRYGENAAEAAQREGRAMAVPYAPYAQQPPIIVVAGPQGMGHSPQFAQSGGNWLPPEPPNRRFTVVGEREELGEEW